MKVYYDAETDSLYIDLTDSPGADAEEVAPNFVLDYDENGNVVGIDIQHASETVDLSQVHTEHIPPIALEQTSEVVNQDRT